ncbi:MAG: F0F1 ATP synthase subunit B [Anaerolineales bacterium]|nr:F0F1 ATP synthase subunit B [Anaerolineales bacterium]MCB9171354.1 F0F1 ATP synthase subunit B [Ardenticatenales bacterium]
MDALGKLGINLPYLIAHIINFLLLMWLLRRFLYGPIMNMLEQRREKIRESLSAAETARAEAAEQSANNEAIIAEARKQARAIVAKSEEDARRRADEIMARANAEAEERRQRVVSDLDEERQAMQSQVRDEVARLSLAIARKTIGASLVNESAHRQIVDEVMAEVGQ